MAICAQGRKSTGEYASHLIFLSKSVIAIGSSAVFFFMSLFGLDAQAPVHTGWEAFGLKAAVTLLPGAAGLIGLIIYVGFPLRPRHGEIIRRRLTQRAERLAQG
jgi:Na+/melibiose symporter-like transporter